MSPRGKALPHVEGNAGAQTSEGTGVIMQESGPDLAGDGGAREEQVSQAQQVFDQLHEGIDLGDEAGLVVKNATDWVVELIKHRPKSWDQLSQAEQRDLVAGIETNMKELVGQVVEAVARTGRDAVRCLFVGFTDKGDDIKAELKVKAYSKEETESAVIALHRARGKHVLVTVATADDFHERPASDSSEPDQRGLEFEAGTDEHPDDDSDLAGSDPEALRHGDKAAFAGANGEVRIDLKRGWVQFIENGEAALEGNWQDMREAKPEELAAERQRLADFDEQEQAEAETVEA